MNKRILRIVIFAAFLSKVALGNPTGMIPDDVDPWEWWKAERDIDSKLLVEVIEPDESSEIINFVCPNLGNKKEIIATIIIVTEGKVEEIFNIKGATKEQKEKIRDSLYKSVFEPAIYGGEKIKMLASIYYPPQVEKVEPVDGSDVNR